MSETTPTNYDLIVCGAGASGMMAAITAAEQGLSVLLLEKNEKPLRKVYITGKGRCNVTNFCSPEECLQNTPTGGKFLFSALKTFPPQKTMDFFEHLGCPLKVERGNRVFPQSDQAASVIDVLRERSRELDIRLRQARVASLLMKDGCVCGVATDAGEFHAPKVILALGGTSYPRTGSTGDGYSIAQAAGHTILPPTGSLVPLVEEGTFCRKLSGLCLRNISLRLQNAKGKTIFEDFGEAEFTDYGLTGPTVLSASCHMGRNDGFTIIIDLKPALSEEKLSSRLLRDLEKFKNCPMETALSELLPRRLIVPLLKRLDIDPTLPANSLRREQRQALLKILKQLPVKILCKRPLEEAIVTSGGVATREVDPKTMQSKLVPGLYFAGELLDIDAYTGGFNLQIAWATGYVAGRSAGEKVRETPYE